MTIPAEWFTATAAAPVLVEAGAFEDSYGSVNDLPALIIDSGSSLGVVEATHDQPVELINQITTRLAEATGGAERHQLITALHAPTGTLLGDTEPAAR